MDECRRIHDLVGPYLYDDLPEAERRKVDEHLRACEACQAEAEALRALVARLPATLGDTPAGAEQRVLRGVQRRLAARRPAWPGALRPALLAAAALALGVWIGYRLPRTSPAPAPVAVAEPRPQPAPAETRTAELAPATESAVTRVRPVPRPQPVPAPRRSAVTGSHPHLTVPGPEPPQAAQVAVPPADRTAETSVAPAPEPPQAGLRTVVIAPRPVGGDDVQLAEVVKMEAIR
jgi:hypothetical protein